MQPVTNSGFHIIHSLYIYDTVAWYQHMGSAELCPIGLISVSHDRLMLLAMALRSFIVHYLAEGVIMHITYRITHNKYITDSDTRAQVHYCYHA